MQFQPRALSLETWKKTTLSGVFKGKNEMKKKFTSKGHLHDLVHLLLKHGFLTRHHPQCKQEHQNTMTHISKHHSKQERERHDGEDCWVDFTISGNSISVNNLLEGVCQLVCLKVSWRRLISHQRLKHCSHLQNKIVRTKNLRNQFKRVKYDKTDDLSTSS